MKSAIHRLLAAIAALLFAAALSVGARQALAADVVTSCLDDGYNYLGACISHDSCNTRCLQVGGVSGVCYANDTCCKCFH